MGAGLLTACIADTACTVQAAGIGLDCTTGQTARTGAWCIPGGCKARGRIERKDLVCCPMLP